MDPQPSDSKIQELENMKRRLQEIEQEAGMLRQMQAKAEKDIGDAPAQVVDDSNDIDAVQAEKEEVDSRSIFVGNVDYECTPEEIQMHFQSCGTINRVTILTDRFDQPKGFAYVEFLETQAVQNAIALNETELHGRPLKVSAKRTNIPGMRQHRSRRQNPYFEAWNPYVIPEPPFFAPCGYGRVPRYRRPYRYRPY